MMNTLEIELILQAVSPHFAGVYARNTLPSCPLSVPSFMVCNTDPDNKQGQHWIAMYIDEKRRGEYYDPYGLSPFHLDFINFLNRQCKTWIYNPVAVQHLNSLVCGQHCIYYLVHREMGMTMNDITEYLQSEWHANTYIVDDFVHHLERYLL
ncbi:hypothetical protein CI610_02510 [invertebrate metagenome]|uniref:Ubiquitin-like protease family profile domain-containing protein n=1 Tax=invertebrate metagenome TaxID=1711999 RepID=A0A2H9T5P2_9ZZZZ